MNKPLTMYIKETKTKLINVCNESGLSPILLDLILQGIYNEIHNLAEKQTADDEKSYLQSVENITHESLDNCLNLEEVSKDGEE